MNVPPEVYGCLSLASSYERRRGDFWKKGNGFKRKAFKAKCEKKIARLVSRAVRLLAGRGIDVGRLASDLQEQHAKETQAARAQGALPAGGPRRP